MFFGDTPKKDFLPLAESHRVRDHA